MYKLIILLILISCNKTKVNFTKVDTDLKNFDNLISGRKVNFKKEKADVSNKDWVKRKLKFMFYVDQYVRRFASRPSIAGYTESEKKYFFKEYTNRFNEHDLYNANELKNILTVYGWIKISEFGKQADQHAWIIVQHADHDRKFQKFILKQLNVLRYHGETSHQNYAYLYDRVQTSFTDPKDRKLQLYGTQGACDGKNWKFYPVEDEPKLNKRRKEVGLGTIADYVGSVSRTCI
jgi:hypothetical protein